MVKKLKDIVQFAPDSERPEAPGTYGWGFDLNGYRVVMYRPEEFDHPVVKAIDARINHSKDTKKIRKTQQRGQARPKPDGTPENDVAIGRQEHGPAHIHVIEKATGRESKFELIEHYAPDGNDIRLIDKNGCNKEPLTPAQVGELLPILQVNSTRFIQLWRESYADAKLGNYVTRISEKFPKCRERILFTACPKEPGKKKLKECQKWVELEDIYTKEKTVMSFHDYKAMEAESVSRNR